jgi:hypothetical protein
MRQFDLQFSCLLFFGLVTFVSCKKEGPDPNDPVPVITAVQVAPSSVVEYSDSIVFSVSYQDGDGDLGENNPDAENLFLIDNRLQIIQTFRIPQLAPSNAVIPIQGTLDVVLPSTGITDGSASQQATFTVYVRDRAGHESNRFVTSAVTVVR